MNLFYEQQKEMTQANMTKLMQGFHTCPLISIIMPVYNVAPKWLAKAINSLVAQSYEHWELCAVDDGSTREDTKDCLRDYARREPRVKASFQPQNAGISAASNVSLAMAQGEFVALMDNDDELAPDALFWVAKEINEYPEADFIYTDECNIDDNDSPNLFGFIYKPNYSPEFLKRCMYTAHLTVYKTTLVRKVGGFRSCYDFAQDYDLALRVSERAKCVRHIERILYLWRAITGSFAAGGKLGIEIVGANVAADMLTRRGIDGIILSTPFGLPYKVRLKENPLVSIIIPSDNYDYLADMVTSLNQNTAYANYEIIAVCNNDIETRLRATHGYIKNLYLHVYNQLGNTSGACNAGAKKARGEILVFCRDILAFAQGGWLNALVELLVANPEIGASSPKVLRTDDTIQYAGAIVGGPDLIDTPYTHTHKDAIDLYWSRYNWTREVSVLSATCLAVKRQAFIQTNGFDTAYTPDKYSNADLSFKIRELGLTCVYNNRSEVTNRHGSRSDSWQDTPAFLAKAYMQDRWGSYLNKDPYFTESMKKAIMEVTYE